MAINFKDDAFVEHIELQGGELTKLKGIPTSKNVTGIEVRLSKAFIKDNKTIKFGPFPGFAQLYLIAIVVNDKGEVLQNLDIKGFPKVGDHEDLPVDKTIYYWKQNFPQEQSPSQIHVLTSIIKSKQKLRDTGKVMSDVKNDAEFSGMVSTLKQVIKNANAVAQVSDVLFSAAALIGKFLGKLDDKPLLTWVQSYTDINGDFDNLGKITTGKSNKNATLDLAIIIRDTSREVEMANMQNMVIEELEIDRNGEIN